MTLNKHITRDFDANRTNKIRYDSDQYKLEIYKFDKTKEATFTINDNITKSSNTTITNFCGMLGYKSNDKTKSIKLTFYYNSEEASDNFRLECLYANTYFKGLNPEKDPKTHNNKPIVKVLVNNKEIKTGIGVWASNDTNYNRHYSYVKLKKGKNKIQYIFSPNVMFFGLAIKKYDIWTASRIKNQLISNDKLELISAETSRTKDFGIDTLKCEFMYYHGLDEKLAPTNLNANRSGFVFDYRDEINLYIWDTKNVKQQVFGGYISTCTVNDDLTVLTLECANRLIDLDRRFCLSEIKLKGDKSNDNVEYTEGLDFLKRYNTYGDSIAFLLKTSEVPLLHNIKRGKGVVRRKNYKLASYGKGGYNKFNLKNMIVNVNKDYVTIRNGADRFKAQSITIFDAKNKKISLNNYPNLYLRYGLGREVYNETVKHTEVIVENSFISKSVINYANGITKSTGNGALKALFTEIANEIKTDTTKGFNKTPAKVITSKVGNDCCKTELLLDCCNIKNIPNLQYVYIKNKKTNRGHVFARIDGVIVDPSIKGGWRRYRGQGTGVFGDIKSATITNYPSKPKI